MKISSLSLLMALGVLPAVQGGRKCTNPKGNDGESYTEGCLKMTCKAGVWRSSLDASLCCYNRQPYLPNTTITATEDGCATAVIYCKQEDDVATVVLQVENNCGDHSTEEQVQEIKHILVKHMEQADCDKDSPVPTSASSTTTTPTHGTEDAKEFQDKLSPNINKEEAICKAPWIQLSTGCYLFSEESMNWSKAKQFCQNKNAKLVEIGSAEEDEVIIDGIYSQHYDTLKRQPWIGLTDAESEGNFKFASSGNIAVYTNWAPNEPNDKYGTENCVHIGMEWWAKDKWNDNNCNFTEEHGYTFHAMCEKLG